MHQISARIFHNPSLKTEYQTSLISWDSWEEIITKVSEVWDHEINLAIITAIILSWFVLLHVKLPYAFHLYMTHCSCFPTNC